MASSRVISRTTSPFWFLPRKRNFTRPAWPGFPKAERRGSSSVFESTVLSKTEDDPRLSAFGKPGTAGVVKFLLRGKNQKGEVVLEITRELAILKQGFRP